LLRAKYCFAALAVTAGLATGCGQSQQSIATSQAQALISDLDLVTQQVADRRCTTVEGETLPRIEQLVASLPSSTDSGTRMTLADSTSQLRSLVTQQCRPPTVTTTPSTETTTPTTRRTTRTQPPSTETKPKPPTQTQPPTTTSTPSVPTQTTPTTTPTEPTGPTTPTTPTNPGGLEQSP
jgi:hypothetical protein